MKTMKNLFSLVTLIFLLSCANAYAGQWELIASDFQMGTGWMCTYQLQGSGYQMTIISQGMCKMFIYR